MWRVKILSDSSPPCRLLCDFFDRFIAMFGIESIPKNFWGKVYDWLKKGLFLIVNLFLHFNRMDARNLHAQRRVLFILL